MASLSSIAERVSAALKLSPSRVESTIALLEQGCTIPFITRYRKEQTGGLDEVAIRDIKERFERSKHLEDRRQTVLKQIEQLGKLDPSLQQKIQNASSLVELEDLYLPFKPKKCSLADVAKEKGLEPLALQTWKQELLDTHFDLSVRRLVIPDKGLHDVQEVITGVQHILAERVAESAEIRTDLRTLFQGEGLLMAKGKASELQQSATSIYRDYLDFTKKISSVKSYQILAINRGEANKALQVKVDVPYQSSVEQILSKHVLRIPRSDLQRQRVRDVMWRSMLDSYHRLIYPQLSREIRKSLTASAEEASLPIFSNNLRSLVMAPPLRGKTVIGLDPGFKNGTKWAIVDSESRLLETGVIYPHPPQKRFEESINILFDLYNKFKFQIAAIGNGTASRETTELVAELIKKHAVDVQFTVVDESGASVYSASVEAKQEFPNLHADVLGAVSIARRLQDPLSEIVKIDPQSIGVGQYQHDVDQKLLSRHLGSVVESCVNQVGVDVNRASVHLLKYVSGLKSSQAKSIFEYIHGEPPSRFQSRSDLLSIKGIGKKAYEQAAGFLRIYDGSNPLDSTSVHPESYHTAEKILQSIQATPSSLLNRSSWTSEFCPKLKSFAENESELNRLSKSLGVGLPTVKDIIEFLLRPDRDPREAFTAPRLATALSMDDLTPGTQVEGTVRNIVQFGAFVDLGLKRQGLIHITEMSDEPTSDPLSRVAVGQVVRATVITVDLDRGRIGLSLKSNPVIASPVALSIPAAVGAVAAANGSKRSFSTQASRKVKPVVQKRIKAESSHKTVKSTIGKRKASSSVSGSQTKSRVKRARLQDEEI